MNASGAPLLTQLDAVVARAHHSAPRRSIRRNLPPLAVRVLERQDPIRPLRPRDCLRAVVVAHRSTQPATPGSQRQTPPASTNPWLVLEQASARLPAPAAPAKALPAHRAPATATSLAAPRTPLRTPLPPACPGRVKRQNVCLGSACRGVRCGLFGCRLSVCIRCR